MNSSEPSSYAMNTFSTEAMARSQLFESVAVRNGFTLIGGRFGGEFNNDQLATRREGGLTQLLLGLKVTDASGNLQLDQLSMGPHQQFSKNWILSVIHSLKLDPMQAAHATTIDEAYRDRALGLYVLLLVKPGEEVKFLRISLPE